MKRHKRHSYRGRIARSSFAIAQLSCYKVRYEHIELRCNVLCICNELNEFLKRQKSKIESGYVSAKNWQNWVTSDYVITNIKRVTFFLSQFIYTLWVVSARMLYCSQVLVLSMRCWWTWPNRALQRSLSGRRMKSWYRSQWNVTCQWHSTLGAKLRYKLAFHTEIKQLLHILWCSWKSPQSGVYLVLNILHISLQLFGKIYLKIVSESIESYSEAFSCKSVNLYTVIRN